jgi:hypothetical protein
VLVIVAVIGFVGLGIAVGVISILSRLFRLGRS